MAGIFPKISFFSPNIPTEQLGGAEVTSQLLPCSLPNSSISHPKSNPIFLTSIKSLFPFFVFTNGAESKFPPSFPLEKLRFWLKQQREEPEEEEEFGNFDSSTPQSPHRSIPSQIQDLIWEFPRVLGQGPDPTGIFPGLFSGDSKGAPGIPGKGSEAGLGPGICWDRSQIPALIQNPDPESRP